jgi:hypothetical chaperone protein
LKQENLVVGIDFGTTNSSVALVRHGQVEEVQFNTRVGSSRSSRSLLYLERGRGGASAKVPSWTGAEAVEHYLEANEEEVHKRLIQSLKSHLAARGLTGTEIFNRQYRFEDLVARILRDLRRRSSEAFGFDVTRAVVGRPVMFVGAENEADNEYAQQRLFSALTDAGFEDVRFAMEPVAAAHAYAAMSSVEGVSLIGDFGGGTTDFSLLQLRDGASEVIASTGVGLAGDAFDARIVRRLISPALGSEATYLSFGKQLSALPAWVYQRLENWHTLSFLRTREVRDMLRSAEKRASEPNQIHALRMIVEEDLGFPMHQAVQRVKVQLSDAEAATFVLDTSTLRLEQDVTRSEFETWIAPELLQMRDSIEALLTKAGMPASSVEHVFLTGGTSLVPAVKRIFEESFRGAEISSGDVFTSVAQGLALIAANENNAHVTRPGNAETESAR